MWNCLIETYQTVYLEHWYRSAYIRWCSHNFVKSFSQNKLKQSTKIPDLNSGRDNSRKCSRLWPVAVPVLIKIDIRPVNSRRSSRLPEKKYFQIPECTTAWLFWLLPHMTECNGCVEGRGTTSSSLCKRCSGKTKGHIRTTAKQSRKSRNSWEEQFIES